MPQEPETVGATRDPRLRVEGPRAASVGTITRRIVAHPLHHALRCWNWKTAASSAVVRGLLYFGTNASAGLGAARAAMTTEIVFRLLVSGYCGTVTQAYRLARPRWASNLVVTAILPALLYLLEFLVHWWRGTPELVVSVLASLAFASVSSAFNLFAMRRGALLVGSERTSLLRDWAALPGLLFQFLVAAAREGGRFYVAAAAAVARNGPRAAVPGDSPRRGRGASAPPPSSARPTRQPRPSSTTGC